MLRFAPRCSALLLAAFALAGCSTMGMGDLSSEKKDKDIAAAIKDKAPTPKAVAADMDGNLRQAMLLRQAGSYDAAIRILSQLLLADADNARVTAEYGKALAQKGRAQDATQFLRRAIEMTPGDWTLYSALGVSYDQLNDQANASLAYEHALAIKPGEASVLNNFAFSRMLAKDTRGAQLFIAQAQAAAGSGADPMIARNLALITSMAPEKAIEAEKPTVTASAVKQALEAGTPSQPKTVAAASAPKPESVTPAPAPARVAAAPQNDAPQNASDVSKVLTSQDPVAASAAPRPLTQTATVQPQNIMPSGVVMQTVPYDPYAGPVVKLKKPQPKTVAKVTPKTDAPKNETAKDDKPAASPTKASVPLKAAKADVVPMLRVAADNY